MIIFEGKHGCIDYDILDITKDGTRKIIVRGRGAIKLSDQIAGAAVYPNLIKREAYIKLKKLVAELGEDLEC